MATYKGIQGYSVQNLSSDPTVADVAGQLWYNSGTGKFKVAVQAAGAWASGGDIGTTRYSQAGAGLATAGLIFGGRTTTQVALTESYDGSTWTEVGDLTLARNFNAGMGTNTAALCVGGAVDASIKVETEEWNGTAWTEVGDLATARRKLGSCGTTTAGLVSGGGAPRSQCSH